MIYINMRCPAPKVANSISGRILLKDIKKIVEIFQKVRKRIIIPFSIKIRSGWDEILINALKF